MVSLFGEAGRHTRTAVGVANLPRGATVEIDALFEIMPSLRSAFKPLSQPD